MNDCQIHSVGQITPLRRTNRLRGRWPSFQVARRGGNSTGLPVWIHVGLQKTGTSSLQRRIFSQHSEILYLGKEVGKTYLQEHPLHKMAQSPPQNFDLESTRTAFAAMMDAGRKGMIEKRVCVLSEEGLTATRRLNPVICASRSRELFPDARILLVLRDPVEWLQSMYFHRLSRRSPETLDGLNPWVRETLARPEVGTDCSILHIGTIAGSLTNEFGAGNLKVMFYEDFRADAAGFISEICGQMNVGAEEAMRLYNSKSKFVNLRISKRQQDFCMSFKLVIDGRYKEYIAAVSPLLESLDKNSRETASSLLPDNFIGEERAIRKQLLVFSQFVEKVARAYLQSGEQASTKLDQELRRRVAEMVAPGFRQITATLGIKTQHYIESAYSMLT